MKLFIANGLIALALSMPQAFAADHVDATLVTADPGSDITDVYSWVNGNKVVLVLNVSPSFTASNRLFSDAVSYVLHTASGSAYGSVSGDNKIIVQFDTNQTIRVWYGTNQYLTGSASASSGLASTDGKFKIFAGERRDPFFFNLNGFKNAVATVTAAAPSLTFDPDGCPVLDGATAQLLRDQLSHSPDTLPPTGGAGGTTLPAVDFFADKSVLSIVVELDKSLVNQNGPITAVWASTHAR